MCNGQFKPAPITILIYCRCARPENVNMTEEAWRKVSTMPGEKCRIFDVDYSGTPKYNK